MWELSVFPPQILLTLMLGKSSSIPIGLPEPWGKGILVSYFPSRSYCFGVSVMLISVHRKTASGENSDEETSEDEDSEDSSSSEDPDKSCAVHKETAAVEELRETLGVVLGGAQDASGK